MPDVRIGAFRDAIRTSTGTDDFTVEGLGVAAKHKAVLLFGNRATADATPVDHAGTSLGYAVSSSNRRVHASRVQHGATSNTDGHNADDLWCYALIGTGGQTFQGRADFDSFIDEGVRLDVESAPASPFLLHGLIFSGADVQADIKSVTVSDDVDGTADVAIGFEPNLAILTSDGDQYDGSTSHEGMFNQSVCFCRNDKAGTVQHAALGIALRGDDDTRGTAGNFGEVSTTRMVVCDPTWNGAAPDWEFELSFPNPTTARVTTKVVGDDPEPPQIGLLLIDTGDTDVQVGVASTPTATGEQTVDLDCDWTPQAVLFAVSQITAVDTFRGQSAEPGTVGLAVATAAHQGCATVSNSNLAEPTDTQSLSDDKLCNVPAHNGATSVEATFTEFVDGGVTANFSAVTGSALRWPYLAIEASAPTIPGLVLLDGVLALLG